MSHLLGSAGVGIRAPRQPRAFNTANTTRQHASHAFAPAPFEYQAGPVAHQGPRQPRPVFGGAAPRPPRTDFSRAPAPFPSAAGQPYVRPFPPPTAGGAQRRGIFGGGPSGAAPAPRSFTKASTPLNRGAVRGRGAFNTNAPLQSPVTMGGHMGSEDAMMGGSPPFADHRAPRASARPPRGASRSPHADFVGNTSVRHQASVAAKVQVPRRRPGISDEVSMGGGDGDDDMGALPTGRPLHASALQRYKRPVQSTEDMALEDTNELASPAEGLPLRELSSAIRAYGFPPGTAMQALRQHFYKFGRVSNIRPVWNKGFVIITYETPDQAKAAKLGGTTLESGDRITISYDRSQPNPAQVHTGEAGGPAGGRGRDKFGSAAEMPQLEEETTQGPVRGPKVVRQAFSKTEAAGPDNRAPIKLRGSAQLAVRAVRQRPAAPPPLATLPETDDEEAQYSATDTDEVADAEYSVHSDDEDEGGGDDEDGADDDDEVGDDEQDEESESGADSRDEAEEDQLSGEDASQGVSRSPVEVAESDEDVKPIKLRAVPPPVVVKRPSLDSLPDAQMFAAERRAAPDPALLLESDGVVGRVFTMCPAVEIADREQTINEIRDFEKPLGSKTVADLVIKQYKRSAAGSEEQTDPLVVRPPLVLKKTLDYLTSVILDADRAGPDPRFIDDHGRPRAPTAFEIEEFMWNRIRAIGRDFISQNYREGGRNDAVAMECHERMVRIHILFNYELCEDERFPDNLNQAQLNAYLKFLLELYDDARKRSIPGVAELYSPNEAEFRAYYILVHMVDSSARESIYGSLRTLPTSITQHPDMVHVLKLFSAFLTGNFINFWKLAQSPSTSPLMACLLHRTFPVVRARAIAAMTAAYGVISKGDEESDSKGPKVADVKRMLALPDKESAVKYLQHHGIKVIRRGHGHSVVFEKGSFMLPTEGGSRYMKRLREPLNVPEPLITHLRRKDVVDTRLWAGSADAAAFAPRHSKSGIIPSGIGIAAGHAATDLYPGAPYAVPLSDAKEFVRQRRPTAAAAITKASQPKVEQPLALTKPVRTETRDNILSEKVAAQSMPQQAEPLPKSVAHQLTGGAKAVEPPAEPSTQPTPSGPVAPPVQKAPLSALVAPSPPVLPKSTVTSPLPQPIALPPVDAGIISHPSSGKGTTLAATPTSTRSKLPPVIALQEPGQHPTISIAELARAQEETRKQEDAKRRAAEAAALAEQQAAAAVIRAKEVFRIKAANRERKTQKAVQQLLFMRWWHKTKKRLRARQSLSQSVAAGRKRRIGDLLSPVKSATSAATHILGTVRPSCRIRDLYASIEAASLVSRMFEQHESLLSNTDASQQLSFSLVIVSSPPVVGEASMEEAAINDWVREITIPKRLSTPTLRHFAVVNELNAPEDRAAVDLNISFTHVSDGELVDTTRSREICQATHAIIFVAHVQSSGAEIAFVDGQKTLQRLGSVLLACPPNAALSLQILVVFHTSDVSQSIAKRPRTEGVENVVHGRDVFFTPGEVVHFVSSQLLPSALPTNLVHYVGIQILNPAALRQQPEQGTLLLVDRDVLSGAIVDTVLHADLRPRTAAVTVRSLLRVVSRRIRSIILQSKPPLMPEPILVSVAAALRAFAETMLDVHCIEERMQFFLTELQKSTAATAEACERAANSAQCHLVSPTITEVLECWIAAATSVSGSKGNDSDKGKVTFDSYPLPSSFVESEKPTAHLLRPLIRWAHWVRRVFHFATFFPPPSVHTSDELALTELAGSVISQLESANSYIGECLDNIFDYVLMHANEQRVAIPVYNIALASAHAFHIAESTLDGIALATGLDIPLSLGQYATLAQDSLRASQPVDDAKPAGPTEATYSPGPSRRAPGMEFYDPWAWMQAELAQEKEESARLMQVLTDSIDSITAAERPIESLPAFPTPAPTTAAPVDNMDPITFLTMLAQEKAESLKLHSLLHGVLTADACDNGV